VASIAIPTIVLVIIAAVCLRLLFFDSALDLTKVAQQVDEKKFGGAAKSVSKGIGGRIGKVSTFCVTVFLSARSKIRIVLGTYQMLTGLGFVFTIPYPEFYRSWLRVLDTVNLNLIQLLPISCIGEYNFYSSLLVHTLVPLCVIITLFITRQVLLSERIAEWMKQHAPRICTEKVADRCSLVAFLVIFLVYPSVSSKIFATFACDELDAEYDGSDSWLRADLSISCNASDRAGWLAFAVIMIFIYPFGVPAFCATTAARTWDLH
jgi:hypothetical protein